MNSVSDLKLVPFFALTQKEILRFMKVIGQTVLTPIINSVLYLLIFGLSLGSSISLANGLSYLAFLVPGLVMMSALNNAYQNSASSIIGSKFHGDLADLRVMPLSSRQIVWAMSLGGLVRGLMVSGLTLAVSEIFHILSFSKSFVLSIQYPVLFLAFLIIGSLCFAMFGIAVGFKASSFDKVNAISSFVLLPLLYLGGVFFSLEQLHPAWQAIAKVNPLMYFINGMRFSCFGSADVSFTASIGVAVVTLIVMFVIATNAVKRGSYTRW